MKFRGDAAALPANDEQAEQDTQADSSSDWNEEAKKVFDNSSGLEDWDA